MKKFETAVVMLLLVAISHFVNALGLMVFWNHLVLNVWHLFTTADVTTTMQISYGVFLAISFGIGLINGSSNVNSTSDPAEALSMVLTSLFGKLIMIGITMLVITIVF